MARSACFDTDRRLYDPIDPERLPRSHESPVQSCLYEGCEVGKLAISCRKYGGLTAARQPSRSKLLKILEIRLGRQVH
jgi:hypothetical protein